MKAIDQDVGRLATGASISIVGKFLGRGVNFIIQVILARYLGPGIFGLYAISWALLRIVGMIAPLGLEHGIVRYGLSFRQNNVSAFKNTFFTSFLLTLLASTSFLLIFYYFSPEIAQFVFNKPELETYLKIFSFSIPFIAVLRLLSTATTISKSTKYFVLSEEVSQPLFELLFILVVILFSLGNTGILWSSVLAFVIAAILSMFFTYKLFPEIFTGNYKLEKELTKSLVFFSVPVAFANLIGLAISWLDRILVGFFLTENDAGIYASVSLVSVLFVTILSGIKLIFSPMIADLFLKGESQQLESIYRISTKWGLYISIPFSLFLLVNGKEFLNLVFGPQYDIGYLALIILVAGQLINIGTGPLDIVFIMTQRNKDWFRISFFAFVSNIFILSLLIPRYGITGAAIGTSITTACMYIIGLFVLRKNVKVWPYDQRYLKGIAAALATSIVLIVLKSLQLPLMLSVIVSISTAFIVFGLFLILLHLDKEDIWVIERVQQRFIRSDEYGR